jgi:hypothetical protein
MLQLTELTKGVEIIDPFLKGFGFVFEDFEIEKNPDTHVKYVSYRNGSKKFLIEFHFSIGLVLYQFENAIASHPFYLDQLGYKDKKLHSDYISENHPETFTRILHDFDFLVDDFFQGECLKLKEISKLQDNFITETERISRRKENIRIDNFRIEQARQEFRMKEFTNCIKNYSFVENIDLLVELDYKIIEFCKRHI